MDDKELASIRSRLRKAERIQSSINSIESTLEHNFSIMLSVPEFGDHGVLVPKPMPDDDKLREDLKNYAANKMRERLMELKLELKNL